MDSQAPKKFNLKEKEKNAPGVSFMNTEFLTLVVPVVAAGGFVDRTRWG